MSKTATIEFSVKLSSIKLTSGEEIIGAIAEPLPKYLTEYKTVGKDFDSLSYVFFPAKVTYIVDALSQTSNIQLSRWSQINASNVFPIPKVNIISVVSASEKAQAIYEEWFQVVYKLKPKECLQQTIRLYFGLAELPQSKLDLYIPEVYPVKMFSTLDKDNKELSYNAILSLFESNYVH